MHSYMCVSKYNKQSSWSTFCLFQWKSLCCSSLFQVWWENWIVEYSNNQTGSLQHVSYVAKTWIQISQVQRGTIATASDQLKHSYRNLQVQFTHESLWFAAKMTIQWKALRFSHYIITNKKLERNWYGSLLEWLFIFIGTSNRMEMYRH